MKVRFSLLQTIGIALTTGLFFGLTFNLRSGGFTPTKQFVISVRQKAPLPNEDCGGDGTWVGFPFANLERVVSWAGSIENWETTVERKTRVLYSGIGLNLASWFVLSTALWLAIGKMIWRK